MNTRSYTGLAVEGEGSCPSEACGQNSNEISLGLEAPDPVGRRIYVQETSLSDLAAQGEEEANLIYRMLSRIIMIKLVYSTVQQDGVYLGLITSERAQSIAQAAKQTWSEYASTALRRVGYRPLEPALRSDFYALLGQDESIIATCYFSNYYTFATGAQTAMLMYEDTNDIATMKRKRDEGVEYKDLTLISGRCLALIDPKIGTGPQKANSYFRPGRKETLSASAAKEIKADIYNQIQRDFETIIKTSINLPTPTEQGLLDGVSQSIQFAFSRGILNMN